MIINIWKWSVTFA